jgi:hypothetical protein
VPTGSSRDRDLRSHSNPNHLNMTITLNVFVLGQNVITVETEPQKNVQALCVSIKHVMKTLDMINVENPIVFQVWSVGITWSRVDRLGPG